MNIYGVCDNNCHHLVYTREEVLSLLQQAIENQSLADIDPDYAAISCIKDQNGGDDVTVWVGSEAEFNALSPAPTVSRAIPRVNLNNGEMYFCIDDSSISDLPTQSLTVEEIDFICS